MYNSKLNILIVLYQPTVSSLERIEKLSKFCNLYIYDNSIDNKSSLKCTMYYHSSSNSGITGALAWMVREMSKKNEANFLFFDQDTFINKEAIHKISEIQKKSKPSILINFCGNPVDYNNTPYFIINSGTLFPVSLLKKLQISVLERYFVDAVDLAICIHADLNGYSIEQFEIPEINHKIEQGYRKTRLLKLNVKHYSRNRSKEFMNSHLRLFQDCLKYRKIKPAMKILKFIIGFQFGRILNQLDI